MARITKPLTNTEIEKAKPRDKDYKLMDGQGLFLLIKATGGRLWRLRYIKPLSAKQTDVSLGSYPDISLQKARKIRDEYLALLAVNIDPQVHRQNKIDEELAKRDNTLRKVAEKWREKKAPEVQAKTMASNWANNAGCLPLELVVDPLPRLLNVGKFLQHKPTEKIKMFYKFLFTGSRLRITVFANNLAEAYTRLPLSQSKPILIARLPVQGGIYA